MTTIQLTEARQKAEAARKQIEEAQETMATAIKEAISEGFAPIFKQYPFLGSISWTQYTPYFNDGETCVFRSHWPYLSVNSVVDGEEGTIGHHEEPGEDFGAKSEKQRYIGYDSQTRTSQYEDNPTYDPEYAACAEAVKEIAQAIHGGSKRPNWDTPSTFDSALQRAFGDHALVSANRDGTIEVDTYDHE